MPGARKGESRKVSQGSGRVHPAGECQSERLCFARADQVATRTPCDYIATTTSRSFQQQGRTGCEHRSDCITRPLGADQTVDRHDQPKAGVDGQGPTRSGQRRLLQGRLPTPAISGARIVSAGLVVGLGWLELSTGIRGRRYHASYPWDVA